MAQMAYVNINQAGLRSACTSAQIDHSIVLSVHINNLWIFRNIKQRALNRKKIKQRALTSDQNQHQPERFSM